MKTINKNISLGNIKSMNKSDNNIILINKNNENIVDELYFHDENNIKMIQRYIKKIEKDIRKSDEYSKYIGYLNNEIGIDRCSIKGNIKGSDATLEFHHYPFTLYDIVEIVMNKYIIENKKFTTFTITEEIMKLHYDNKIGLVKLSKTMHELVHSGEIFIPLDSIFGNVNEFINDYYNYIFPDLIEKYNQLIELNNNN